MTQLSVHVQGCNVEVKLEGRLTSGMVGVPVQFSFDDAWDNLRILAVFRCMGTTFAIPLIDSKETTVPWEVMCQPGDLEIGAEGRSEDGGVVIPTVWAKADRIYPGVNATNELALAATPKLYDRLMTLVENPPIRGIDYWTEADREQIISDVIAALPVYNGEVL